MKQYKTLKDLPGVKAGEILKENIDTGYFSTGENSRIYEKEYLKRYPDFFEEVIEMEKLFTIEDLFKVIKFRIYAPDDLAMKQLDLFISENHPQHTDQLKYIK